MDELTITKALALAITFVLAFTAGMLPIKLRNLLLKKSLSEQFSKKLLSASLCFGAGVLMSIVLLHILKETREKFTEVIAEHQLTESDYPIAELVLCLGFFLIYFLEELVHLFIKYRHSEEEDVEPMGICHFKRSSLTTQSFRSIREDSVISKRNREDRDTERNNIKSIENNNSHQHQQPQQVQQIKCCCSMAHNDHNIKNGTVAPPQQSHNGHSHMSGSEGNLDGMALVRSIFIILALSVHGAFEGMSLGLENTANDVWLLCVALSVHKVFIGFSIGMELLEEGIERLLYIIHICIFSIASPVGGLIGTFLKTWVANTNEAGQLGIAVLQGISGGTILYVTFCEILERERTKCKGRFIRLISLFAGFTIMAALQATGAGHHHGEHHHDEHNVHNPIFSINNDVTFNGTTTWEPNLT